MVTQIAGKQKNRSQTIIAEAVAVLKQEADGIMKLTDRIGASFVEMVDIIYDSSGRVIVGGIGKSGIVGQKIVATLNSTGTPALFLHPVEAMHGDLGIVRQDDVFLALSNSGETDELNVLLPSIRNIGCTIIAFTGNTRSTLAKHSDIIIDVSVEKEACPLGLTPTVSTTAQLAMGDALAVVLIIKRNFNSSDFKKFHPGGTLGQRLSSKVQDIMLTGAQVPFVTQKVTLEEAIEEIDRHSIGVTLISEEDNTLVGILTDGDIRRIVAKKKSLVGLTVKDVMTRNPRKVGPDTPAYDALNLMEKHEITVLPITDSAAKVKGILHLHDILGKGEFKFNITY